MTAALWHRGPDDGNVEVIPQDGAALGMRRLSVIDHNGGKQPMWTADRTACVVFNGEIYNAPALRDELIREGRPFRSHHSDTEVVVNGYAQWGPKLFSRLDGMFALAIWDT